MEAAKQHRTIPVAAIAVFLLIFALSVLGGVMAVHEVGMLGKGVLWQLSAAVVSFYVVALVG